MLNQMNVGAGTRDTLLPDLLGSVVASVDSTTGNIAPFGYRPYGTASAAPAQFGYTGQRVDQETGLYYYRARHYSPAWGRFTQADPIGYQGGINLYGYVQNDPLNLTDPTGMWAGVDDLIAGGIGAVVGVGAQAIADIATGSLSSWRNYAAASVGGAAGGVAALYTGGLASGAVGGAAYSVTSQLLTTGSIDAGRLAFDTGISAISAGLGSAALQAGSRQLSNTVKGQIGEGASLAYNWLQGSRLIGTQQSIPGFRTRVDSVWQSSSGGLYYVESKFGTSGLTAAQREASMGLGSAYQVERWGYDWVGRVGANLGLGYGLGTSASTFIGGK